MLITEITDKVTSVMVLYYITVIGQCNRDCIYNERSIIPDIHVVILTVSGFI